MARGRKPTPEPILKLRGSTVLTRPNRRTPPPAANIQRLAPPCELDPERSTLWESVSRFMAATGVLGQVSPYVLLRYCDLLAAWNRIDAAGVNDLAAIAAKCRLSPCLSKLESVLGLDPASRRGITPAVDDKPDADPIEDLLQSFAPADAAAQS